MSFLLESVAGVLIHQTNLISGAESELRELQKDINQLKDFLRDAEKKPKEDAKLKDLERQIREVIYEVEDTIDACLSQAALAKTKSFIRRIRSRRRTELPKEVNSLRENVVKPILDGVNAYRSTVPVGETSEHEEKPWTVRKKVYPLPHTFLL